MNSINYRAQGLVFDIQRFSIHDGPGIRTIVFLKGCPLSCLWCCNPESQKVTPVVMFQKKYCIGCGKCTLACKKNAIDLKNINLIDRELCSGCGECVNVCPTSALTLKGKKITVEELIVELKKDAINYRRSGGGITISGGEPLVQSEFCLELLKACKAQGWHTAIETTGFSPAASIENVFKYVDLALLDIKSIDDEVHKKYTGVSNEIILKNAKRISEITKTIIRVPVISCVNGTYEGITKIANFAKIINDVKNIHLLPYHTLGENKYNLLGREYLMKEVRKITSEEIDEFKAIVENKGIGCVIGG